MNVEPSSQPTNGPANPQDLISEKHYAIPLPVSLPPLPHEEVHSWSFIRNALLTDQLGSLHRTPSQLHDYQKWTAYIRMTHGNPSNYLIQERLKWIPAPNNDGSIDFAVKSSIPFDNEEDFTILKNDWPYGMEKGIYHLCVWMKSRLDVEGPRGGLSREAKEKVEDFVKRTFTTPMEVTDKRKGIIRVEDGVKYDLSWEINSNAGGDGTKVLWFKNWAELQSVRGIDHIHVLLLDPDPELVAQWMV